LASGQKARVGCSERCNARLTLTIPAAMARRLGFRRQKGPLIVARAVRLTFDAASFDVVLRFTPQSRAKLGRVRSLSVLLSTAVADEVGNRTTKVQKLVIGRAGLK
jgi:hypothetical protein